VSYESRGFESRLKLSKTDLRKIYTELDLIKKNYCTYTIIVGFVESNNVVINKKFFSEERKKFYTGKIIQI